MEGKVSGTLNKLRLLMVVSVQADAKSRMRTVVMCLEQHV